MGVDIGPIITSTQNAPPEPSLQAEYNAPPARPDREPTGQLENHPRQDEPPREILPRPEKSVKWDPVDPLGLFDCLEGPLDWPSDVYF